MRTLTPCERLAWVLSFVHISVKLDIGLPVTRAERVLWHKMRASGFIAGGQVSTTWQPGDRIRKARYAVENRSLIRERDRQRWAQKHRTP